MKQLRVWVLGVLVCFAGFGPATALAAVFTGAAGFDTTFGVNGQKLIDTGPGISTAYGKGYAMALQADGKIVVAGVYPDGRGAVWRLNPDGTLDSSFGTKGWTRPFPDEYGWFGEVAVQGNGKIVLTGGYGFFDSPSTPQFVVAQLNANGSPDIGFDGDGLKKFIVPNATSDQSSAKALALQPDGKILVAGSTGIYDFAVARLTDTGALDTTFNSTGLLSITFGAKFSIAYDMALQPNGKIVLAGYAGAGVGLARVNANGTLDGSFSGDGILSVSISDDPAEGSSAYCVAVQSDGRIVIGTALPDPASRQNHFAVARFTSDGTLDTDFDTDGKIIVPVGVTESYISDITTQSDGKIVVVGSGTAFLSVDEEEEPGDGFAVARLNPNGSPDTSFSGDGQAIVPAGSFQNVATGVAVQGDGKIVVAGHGNTNVVGIVRLNTDGAPDGNFRNGIVQEVDPRPISEGASDMAVQPDGKIIVICGGLVMRLNGDGSLDTSFSGDGKTSVQIGFRGCSFSAVALQKDGKIVVVGYASQFGALGMAVIRLNPDGSLDTSFDGNGKQIITINNLQGVPMGSIAHNVVIQRDGKILLAGDSQIPNFTAGIFTLVRLNVDGSLDTTFSGDGTTWGYVRATGARAVALQADGKIVAVGVSDDPALPGIAMARFTRSGSLDKSFDGDGIALIPLLADSPTLGIVVQSDGNIAIAGSSYKKVAISASSHKIVTKNTTEPGKPFVFRVTAEGAADTTFDGDGLVEFDFGAAYSIATDIALQSDNKIVVAGYAGASSDPTTHSFAVGRLNLDGSLDTSFGGTGEISFPVGAAESSVSCMAIQPDGKILLGGAALRAADADTDVAVVRLSGNSASLLVSNARTFNEGSAATPGSPTFTVTLSAANSQSVTVNYQTANGTATAGADYVAKSGTLSFAPGQTTKFVKVDFIGDSVAEANETFFLDLRTPLNATLADSRGSAYIRNDDGPNLTINNAITVDEGKTGTRLQTFTVTLSAASTNTVTVNWATANGTAGPADYTAASGTLTFAPGETSKVITISVKGDTVVEATETYRVNLSSPTYAVLADSQGVGYIRNDDVSALLFEDEPSE